MPPENRNDLPGLEEVMARFLGQDIARRATEIRKIADYDIGQDRAAALLRFHTFITDPQPSYITAWRSNPVLEQRWYIPHVEGILGDVRGGLAACHYHAERLGEIEAKVTAILRTSNIHERLGNSSIALGGTRKMDFEYQAFILAYRRCLDYLAHSLCCYFKIETNSFRTLPRAISKSKMPDVASAISEAHARHVDTLAFVLMNGRKSVRNRIAHYDFVAAGTINLTPRGVLLVAGGENLGLPGGSACSTLAATLTSRIEHLHACVDDMIDSFVIAASTREKS